MKSGEFARLCGTTKNTLIHYDEIGLLHPAEKGTNRYRNYSVADFTRFSVIRAMTQAGFSLAQIKDMLDTPNPEKLASLAEENTHALKKRLAELKRSGRLLQEIERQALEAQKACFEPMITAFPTRYILVATSLNGLRLEGNWEEVISKDAAIMQDLAALGPEAALAPYGVTAHMHGGTTPEYQEIFYLLPRKPRRAPFGTIHTLEAGDYAHVSFAGSWKEVGKAYDLLSDYIAKKKVDTQPLWYEISQTRLLDTDNNHYRCTVFAPISS